MSPVLVTPSQDRACRWPSPAWSFRWHQGPVRVLGTNIPAIVQTKASSCGHGTKPRSVAAKSLRIQEARKSLVLRSIHTSRILSGRPGRADCPACLRKEGMDQTGNHLPGVNNSQVSFAEFHISSWYSPSPHPRYFLSPQHHTKGM